MSIPDYQSLMLPVLQIAADGEIRIKDVVERIAEELSLTNDEREELLPSGKQAVFANRVHWAKTYLAKAQLVKNVRRGVVAITPRGREVLAAKPDRIDNNFLKQFSEFEEFVGQSNQTPSDASEETKTIENETATPDEVMRNAHRKIEIALAQELLDRIRTAPSEFFERLIVNLLLAMGYGGSVAEAGRALGRSGDDGVDGVVDQDALGLDQVYIQAKRYAIGNNIGSGAIRDFFGSLDRYKASKGLFVTTSSFFRASRSNG